MALSVTDFIIRICTLFHLHSHHEYSCILFQFCAYIPIDGGYWDILIGGGFSQ